MGGFSVLAFVTGDLARGGIGPANFFETGVYNVTQISSTIGQIDISGLRFRFDVSNNDLRGKTNLVNTADSQCFDGDLSTRTPRVSVGSSPVDVVKVDVGSVGRYFVAVRLEMQVNSNTMGYWDVVGSVDDVTYTTVMSGSISGGAGGGVFGTFQCRVANNIRYLKVRGWYAGTGAMLGVYELAAWRLV